MYVFLNLWCSDLLALWCIQLERLYHQRVLDNLNAIQEQWGNMQSQLTCIRCTNPLTAKHTDVAVHLSFSVYSPNQPIIFYTILHSYCFPEWVCMSYILNIFFSTRLPHPYYLLPTFLAWTTPIYELGLHLNLN